MFLECFINTEINASFMLAKANIKAHVYSFFKFPTIAHAIVGENFLESEF